MKILITGGVGYIGSYAHKLLKAKGFETIILDRNLKSPFVVQGSTILAKADLRNLSEVETLFQEHKIKAVMHFAAFAQVGESVKNPALYYENNVIGTLNLLHCMNKHQVKRFIFSSTAAVYGEPIDQKPLTEKSPTNPINPYGRTKLMIEEVLKDYALSEGLSFFAFRYFNAAGGDPDGQLFFSAKHNLIPIALDAIQKEKPITIFGTDYPTPDGTCLRDYIHIHDLASAHLLALEKLLAANENTRYNQIYNLGNGSGYSVLEVIRQIEKVTSKKANLQLVGRRAGDPPLLLADATLAKKELGWEPQYPELETIIAHAYKVFKPTV